VTVENCVFSNNTNNSDRIDLPDAGGIVILSRIGTVLLRNNVFYGNIGPDVGGAYIQNAADETIIITNNTFYGNEADDTENGCNSLTIEAYDTPVNIYNNILWNVPGPDSLTEFCVNNENGDVYIYNNDHNGYSSFGGNNYEGGNIILDPLFEDPEEGDFHLQAGSPCRNSGYNSAPDIPDSDFEGQPRIMEGNVDMGADEYEDLSPAKIPAMNEWGMIIFMALAAFIAIGFMKKQRKAER
jgi:hypothetical protein